MVRAASSAADSLNTPQRQQVGVWLITLRRDRGILHLLDRMVFYAMMHDACRSLVLEGSSSFGEAFASLYLVRILDCTRIACSLALDRAFSSEYACLGMMYLTAVSIARFPLKYQICGGMVTAFSIARFALDSVLRWLHTCLPCSRSCTIVHHLPFGEVVQDLL